MQVGEEELKKQEWAWLQRTGQKNKFPWKEKVIKTAVRRKHNRSIIPTLLYRGAIIMVENATVSGLKEKKRV